VKRRPCFLPFQADGDDALQINWIWLATMFVFGLLLGAMMKKDRPRKP
jgi:hypothetical protein